MGLFAVMLDTTEAEAIRASVIAQTNAASLAPASGFEPPTDVDQS